MSLLDQQKDAPPEIRAVVNFLRSKNGPKLRTGVLNGKRVDYFKGSFLFLNASRTPLLTMRL
jgi:translocation protein SEC62